MNHEQMHGNRAPDTWLIATALLGAVLCLRSVAAEQQGATTRRVSLDSSSAQANGGSAFASISADGQFVAFSSLASNLVSNDTNQATDIFVKNTSTNALTCVSVSSQGELSNGESSAPSISADGQRVAFASEAFNLVAGDGNSAADVFVRNLASGTTLRASVAGNGTEANDASFGPCISAGGRFVAFASHATNLVPNDTNGSSDVFVRDLEAGGTELISVGAAGGAANAPSESPALTDNGNKVAFASKATNLCPGLGGDARLVWNVFLRDRAAGTTVLVSCDTNGGPGNGNSFVPAVSSDGRYVAFASFASNLVSSDLNGAPDVFVRDLLTGSTVRASIGVGNMESTGRSLRPSLSADGRFVVFESDAGNLVDAASPSGRRLSYLRDLLNGSTQRVIPASQLLSSGGDAGNPVISRDGRWVAVDSTQVDLVSGDTNGAEDVFLWGPLL